MDRYEIIVEINGSKVYLDPSDSKPINLNYSVTDIQDISSVKADFSYTITLPETKNNRYVSDFLSDVSVQSKTNVNKKAPVWIDRKSVV